jgi:multicomponent Na+:H+ antiporter subunit D
MLICLLSLATAIYAKRSVESDLADRVALFWCLYLLLTTGIIGITLTADLFNLFVLLEVTSLSSYALVTVGKGRAKFAGFRYLLFGTIGATFYLIGIGYLYIMTGSLNMQDLHGLLQPLYASRVVYTAFLFILFGLGIKIALFPLHAWLPDAYTYAPSAVSAAMAPLVTKVMAYVVVRVMFNVFGVDFIVNIFRVTGALVWIGALAIIFGAVMALSQSDFKRMLSYIIIAEIGYIIGGIGVANATALKGAIFHIVNDAMMVACLFYVAGMVDYRTKGHRIADFQGLLQTMPITAAVFSVGALAIIGVPPTCGFFSKWYLLLGAVEARQWIFVFALLLCTLINVALFFRVFDKILYVHGHRHAAGDNLNQANPVKLESPLSMLLPASFVALAILLIGLFNQVIVNKLIRYALPVGL